MPISLICVWMCMSDLCMVKRVRSYCLIKVNISISFLITDDWLIDWLQNDKKKRDFSFHFAYKTKRWWLNFDGHMGMILTNECMYTDYVAIGYKTISICLLISIHRVKMIFFSNLLFCCKRIAFPVLSLDVVFWSPFC